MKNLTIIVFILLIAGTACSPSRDKSIAALNQLENELKNDTLADEAKAEKAIKEFKRFAKDFPEDSLAPDYLFKAAAIASGFNKGYEAIEIYDLIISKYQNSKKAPEALFMKAFTYENVLNDITKANITYNKFILENPKHELADDAEQAIKYLGKSTEEMIRDFEELQEPTEDMADQK